MSRSAGRVIALECEAEWKSALDRIPHAFGHTWESCRTMQRTSLLPTFLFCREEGGSRVLCPLAERTFGGYVDVVTPYGFGGFVGEGVGPGLLDAWTGFADERGWVCGFIGLNPLFSPAACRERAEYVEYNDIYLLDLSRPVGDLYADLSENRRRQLRAAEAGAPWLMEDRDRLECFFLEQVSAFLAAKGAGAAYAFAPATYEALLSLHNTLLLGAGSKGRVEAVCVFAYTPYCAEYLFGISLPEGRAFSAALLWNAALRLRSLGIPLLNLGGGVRRDDGVAQFKQRFGARKLPFGSLRQVFRPDVYNALCAEAGADPFDRVGYFPAYRAARLAAPR